LDHPESIPLYINTRDPPKRNRDLPNVWGLSCLVAQTYPSGIRESTCAREKTYQEYVVWKEKVGLTGPLPDGLYQPSVSPFGAAVLQGYHRPYGRWQPADKRYLQHKAKNTR
jgi:hypothetical protein